MKNLFTSHKEELKDLLRYGVLKAEVLENPGLYNGRLSYFMNIVVIVMILYMNSLQMR